MSVQAIGSTLTTANSASLPDDGVSEQDFIQLFVSELQYQDPTQPLDNSQFLTELAQFVGIEQQSEEVTGINNLATLDSSDQTVALLSKTVQVSNADGSTTTGEVTGIQYSTNGVQLTVTPSSGSVMTNVNLSQITLVTP
ncbi:flagellar hook capping FlgD N-terminal domain-containing protein [Dyella caseinilytica]|uniref:Basal-body rod modification protein FlgD n=1 Tax=Dyella caseinilytica TaxID=1849581 RepID=A0ABX7GNR4_9GAMM|nr:flagellar hook capping FlgD N-terminal domain-containing protein [Dyella caseinilytica]QRN52057.1 flagellar hook capping protein [Dyella caseinilytica]GGA15789.1 flagellar basal body rod modification protein FlgD [Dyella caseinilytica]